MARYAVAEREVYRSPGRRRGEGERKPIGELEKEVAAARRELAAYTASNRLTREEVEGNVAGLLRRIRGLERLEVGALIEAAGRGSPVVAPEAVAALGSRNAWSRRDAALRALHDSS